MAKPVPDASDTDRGGKRRRPPAPPTRASEPPARMTRAHGLEAVDGGHIFVNLPPTLLEQFTAVRQLASGGQASLVLCRRNGADELVVVKIFNVKARAGVADPRAQLRGLDPDHVVRYVEPYFGVVDGHWWEVVEYCPEGSLIDLADSLGGTVPPDVLRVIIREVATALDHLHSRTPKVIHRDIKPGNVLVRSKSPLDLVLADFGLAVLTDLSRERRSGSRTAAYAAPEAAGGDVAPALDWWGLGMTIAALAAGRHPYLRPDGVWLSDAQILSEVSTRPVPLEGISDQRLLLLLRGLLTRNPDDRWGAVEVREWLVGGSPAVVDVEATGPGAARVRRVAPFPFAGRAFTDPVALAHALAANWQRAAEVVVGRDFDELVAWVDEYFPDRSLDVIVRARARRQQTVDRTVAEIIVQLDPEAEPVFMGVAVDLPSLAALPAHLDDQVEEVVEKLFHSRSLLAYAAVEGHDQLALVEAQWQDLCAQADRWFAAVPEAGGMNAGTRAVILLAAIDEVAAAQAEAS